MGCGDICSTSLHYASFRLHLTRRRILLMHGRRSRLQLITGPSLLYFLGVCDLFLGRLDESMVCDGFWIPCSVKCNVKFS